MTPRALAEGAPEPDPPAAPAVPEPVPVAWRNRVPLSIMGGISYAFRVESPKGLPDASDWEPLYTDPTFVEMPAIRAATEAEEDLLRQRTELKAELAECKALLLMARDALVGIRDFDRRASIYGTYRLADDTIKIINAALKERK